MAVARVDYDKMNIDDDAFYGPVPKGFVRLYHYTDERGATGIVNSLKICQSKRKTATDTNPRNTDAYFGEGTYLTDKDPEQHSKLDIAKDIWVNRDKFHNKMVKDGRTDFVFAIVIKRSAVVEKVSTYFSVVWCLSFMRARLTGQGSIYYMLFHFSHFLCRTRSTIFGSIRIRIYS